MILHRTAYEDGTNRGLRNVGYQQSDAGETPKRKHITFYDSYLCATVFNFIWVLHLCKLVLHKSQMHVYYESDSEGVNTYFFFFTKKMIIHGCYQFLKREQKKWYAFIAIWVRSNMKSCNVMM
jgi:hypothetical protein